MIKKEVVCLVDFSKVGLTLNGAYIVFKEGNDIYQLIGDKGVKTWGYKEWFKELKIK